MPVSIEELIPWNDGSGDEIHVSYNASVGNQTVEVSSDANTGYESRSKVITFQTTEGSPTVSRSLTVNQAGKDIIIITFNDKAITRNEVAVGYE